MLETGSVRYLLTSFNICPGINKKVPDAVETGKAKNMTKPANSKDKPSPSDTPTRRPNDNGHKSVVGHDDTYTDRKLHKNIAEQREKEEQPVEPIKNPPKEKGMEKGKVQP